MGFFPKDYKGEPDTGKYMRLKQGENTFRVLSSAIVGMEYWKETKDGRKPVRVRSGETISVGEIGDELPKHFWAFVVFNRNSETVQILHLTQSTIRKAITNLINNKNWGDPKGYDITINRDGEGLDTEYTVTPNPKNKLDEGITKLYESMEIDLDQLYEGGDPFGDKSDQLADDVEEALK